jgi:hypothetical protein
VLLAKCDELVPAAGGNQGWLDLCSRRPSTRIVGYLSEFAALALESGETRLGPFIGELEPR